MVVVPAGEFMMGSPADEKDRLRQVRARCTRLRSPGRFAVSKFEVTFDEWDACVAIGRLRCMCLTAIWDGGRQPGHQCKLGRRPAVCGLDLQDDRSALPAALRSGMGVCGSRRHNDGLFLGRRDRQRQCQLQRLRQRVGSRRTAPVGSFAPNQFGLYDMHGNVWEWVEDCLQPTTKGHPRTAQPGCTGDCNHRVVRGGSWINVPRLVRAAVRSSNAPDFRDYDLGFRIGRTLSTTTPITATPGAR